MKTIVLVILTILGFTTYAVHPDKKVKQIGKVYAFTCDANGFNTQSLFYDDGKEVVAFDAQFTPDLAKKAIAYLKTKTSSPIKWLVVTHPNPDKFNGISAFKEEGATVIMSKETAKNLWAVHEYKKYYFVNMAKMFTEETYPKAIEPDTTFDKDFTINLKNGGKVVLTELSNSGISNNQTLAYIPTANALMVGDLVHEKVHAWLEGPIVNGKPDFNLENWINVLKNIRSSYNLDVEVYGGRGASGKLGDIIYNQIAYLQKANDLVKDYIQSLQGETLADKKKKVDYNVLTQLFETNFPDYGLTYMITYGAYGIVDSIK